MSYAAPSRAWKVNLVGEGADDAGGVFDETIAQMCEVSLSVYLSSVGIIEHRVLYT